MGLVKVVKKFLGLGREDDSRKRKLVEEEFASRYEEDEDERPVKRMRKEGPDKTDLHNIVPPPAPPSKGLAERFFGWMYGSKSDPGVSKELSSDPITIQLGGGETIQATEPTLLETEEEVNLVKVDNNKTEEILSCDPLASFSGFSRVVNKVERLQPTAASSTSSRGHIIRTEHEKARHMLGNSPSNLRQKMKSGYRSTYDKFFSEKNIAKSVWSRKDRRAVGNTAFTYSNQLADKDLYRKVLDNYAGSSIRSKHSLIKSPLQTNRSSLFFPNIVTSTTVKTDAGSSRVNESSTSSPVLPDKSRCRKEDLKVVQEITSTPVVAPEKPSFARNSLEIELLAREVYSPKFLAKLREKYDVSSRVRLRAISRETTKKEFFESKNEEVEANINERIKNYLSITQVAIEEPQEEIEEEQDTELPELTDEMKSVIGNAVRSRGETLVDAHKIQITKKDIATLQGLNWLNDEVVNFYMQMIVTRSGTGNWPKVYAFSTFFYPKMMEGGHSSVKRWTKKIDIFSHDLLLVPVHLGMHWCLAVVDLKKKSIDYYDSMGGNNKSCVKALVKYIQDEHKAKKSVPLNMSDWDERILKDIPQQMNGSDCGMFACKFAEYVSRRARITFSQSDMPYFRRRMIWEIVSNSILHP